MDSSYTQPPPGDPDSPDSDQSVLDKTMLLEDILPSFEMHNYMFNRTVFDTENMTQLHRSQQPPTYDANFHDPTTTEASNVPLIQQTNCTDPTSNPDILILNNLKEMQTISLPLKITITLTRAFPKKGKPVTRENALREYQPNDIIAGQVVVENTSNETIPFEMFLVSLEGRVTIPKQGQTGPRQFHQPPTVKTFLNMYDLTACFHTGVCPSVMKANYFVDALNANTTQDAYSNLRFDSVYNPDDGTYYGMPDSKELLPGHKHKKFFMFKLPETLLDIACEHQSGQHLSIPPSFGIDPTGFQGAAGSIKVDEALGYGRLGEIGSPIMTKDLADQGVSISYAVNVKCVGRQSDIYKKYYNKNTSHEYDFITLRDVDHYFRVGSGSPTVDERDDYFFKTNLSTVDQLKDIDRLIEHQAIELSEICQLAECGVTNSDDIDEILQTGNYETKKQCQLQTTRDACRSIEAEKNEIINSSRYPLITVPSASVTHSHPPNNIISSKTFKFVKSFLSKTAGQMEVSVTYPKSQTMKAYVPKTLAKLAFTKTEGSSSHKPSTDSLSKNTSNPKSSNSLFDTASSLSTSPTSTGVSKPLSSLQLTDPTRLNQVEMTLKFKGAIPPPFPITIKSFLKVMNISSTHAIPVTFDSNFLLPMLNSPIISTKSISSTDHPQSNYSKFQNLAAKYGYHFDELLKLYKKLAGYEGIRSRMPKSLYSDLQSLKNLSYTERNLFAFKDVKVVCEQSAAKKSSAKKSPWPLSKGSELVVSAAWMKVGVDEYSVTFQVPLVYNEAKINEYHILPTFQSCFTSRLYSVGFNINCGAANIEGGVKPLDVPLVIS